jgi:hypothetical protein
VPDRGWDSPLDPEEDTMATKPHPDLERRSALSDIDYHEAEGLLLAPEADKAKCGANG